MLFYYTKVQVNELMTPSLLIEQVIYWIQHTKNKMKDLNYDHSLYYSLKEKHKSLEIKDFKTKNILGIQFITDHNYKKNQFTIEILYHYQQEILELSFYKEISNESKYISKISIPKIFPMILESNYIQKDHDLSIQSTPHFINERTVNQLLKKSYHLPIIILYKNKKCLVNPFILNQELYGMCHIIVIPTNKEINYVKINYPNNEKEKLFYEKNFIQTLIQHIRYYMLQENGELLLPEEALAVCKILLGSKVLSKKQIKNIVDKLMKKDSGRAQVVGAGEIRNELEYYRENSEKVELSKIWELERSIEGQKYIDIVLQTDNNEYQKVKIAPKGIVFLEQEFYLAASKGEDDKYLEIYRICDIKEVINLEEKFSVVYAKRFQAGKFREEWEKKMKGSLEGSSLLVECA